MDLKPSTTIDEQLVLIEGKGIHINDMQAARGFLRRTGYYRLRAYFLPFKTRTGYRPVSFDQIMRLYDFDSQLRVWLFDVIGEIESALKADIGSYLACAYGSQCYLEAPTFDSRHKHDAYLRRIDRVIHDNRNAPVVKHHLDKYEGRFPIWVIMEFFSTGMLSFTYADLKRGDRKAIAKMYGTGDQQLLSWLRAFTELRNKCAHYTRLYFWRFITIPRPDTRMRHPADRSLFSQIYMLKFLHPDQDRWQERVAHLDNIFAQYADSIDLSHMGFPTNWRDMLEA
jgi:abortive infection bacteriophage resistance protein